MQKVRRGELRTLQATDEIILLRDGKGAYATIELKSPDLPNEGLGYWICLDGNQEHAYNAIMKDMYEFCQKVGTVYLTERETWQVLRQRLNSKLSYKMQLTSLVKQQCGKVNT